MELEDIIQSMKRYPFYVDHADILQRVVWEPVGKSDIAFDRQSCEEAAFVLPAKVMYNKFFVGPLGAFSPHYSSLDKAKYRMTCIAPENDQLAAMFHRGIQLMRTLQQMVARTTSHQFLLDTVDEEEHIIVSLPVFEKRASFHPFSISTKMRLMPSCSQPVPIILHTYLADLRETKKDPMFDFLSNGDMANSNPSLYAATKNYPVPPKYTDQFDAIKNYYSVNLLPAYYKNKFIPTLKTPRLLENATIELHVAVTHNFMRKDTDKFNSFNRYIRQVIVHEL
ncbi:hypothetical protein JB92DRAFT_3126074 [Gautieria morchelliformis]|nr:hypothetical protein JB92DRAFT_3126074 [Gautieria morchelliformis]